ncbi:MAG: hypothetical protein RL547_1805 [Actinomycetota bacterium]
MTLVATTPKQLRKLNVYASLLHVVQGVAVLLLANDFALPVTSFFWNDAPNNRLEVVRLDRVFDVSVAWAAAIFLFLSALFHAIVATVGRTAYESEIASEQNRFRWIEYSLSSTLMIVTICLVFGIGDIAGLIGIAGANVAMILFGWIMEVVNRPGQPVWWTPFWFGCIVGILPWIGLLVYLLGPGDEMPAFVYGIFVSIFVFFNLFALNQYLQYRKVGKWATYEFGEKIYLWLSLVAKSALAWQLYGNTLSA